MKGKASKDGRVTIRTASSMYCRAEDGDDFVIGGYALKWDDQYNNGYVIESFEQGAFPSERRQDVRLLMSHSGLPVARSSSDTLTLREDDTGLAFEATLDPRDTTSSDIRVKIERGDLDGVSVGFMWRGTEEKYTRPKGKELGRRVITKAGELMEISLVSFPAYKSSGVGLRYDDGSRPEHDAPVNMPNPAVQWQRLAAAKVRSLAFRR